MDQALSIPNAAPAIPPKAAEAVNKIAGGKKGDNRLVLGGLAVAAVIGIAVAAPKDKAAGNVLQDFQRTEPFHMYTSLRAF